MPVTWLSECNNSGTPRYVLIHMLTRVLPFLMCRSTLLDPKPVPQTSRDSESSSGPSTSSRVPKIDNRLGRWGMAYKYGPSTVFLTFASSHRRIQQAGRTNLTLIPNVGVKSHASPTIGSLFGKTSQVT